MKRVPGTAGRVLRAQAIEQAGYVTEAEARAVAYGYRLQHFHRERGHWLQVKRGIHRVSGEPDSPHEDLIRWKLWSRGRDGRSRAAVPHDSALRLHDLGDVIPGKVRIGSAVCGATAPLCFEDSSSFAGVESALAAGSPEE